VSCDLLIFPFFHYYRPMAARATTVCQTGADRYAAQRVGQCGGCLHSLADHINRAASGTRYGWWEATRGTTYFPTTTTNANYCLHVEERGVGYTADLPDRDGMAQQRYITILFGAISASDCRRSYNVVVSSDTGTTLLNGYYRMTGNADGAGQYTNAEDLIILLLRHYSHCIITNNTAIGDAAAFISQARTVARLPHVTQLNYRVVLDAKRGRGRLLAQEARPLSSGCTFPPYLCSEGEGIFTEYGGHFYQLHVHP